MGPLTGVKIIELAGIGPAPFCGMLLADLGADVLRIDRKAGGARSIDIDPARDILNRGRRSIAMDLKHPEAIEALLGLVEKADIFIEGFRPGVTERMGLGPDACLARNSKLVYGRMTGWGQTGPLAQTSGHDINYLALSGALHLIGRKGEKPLPPLNLVGDMGGGGLFLAFGLVCALLESRTSGQGQVVDAAMIEGAALQLSAVLMMRAVGHLKEERGTNLTDTGAHFYEVYETSDGGFISIASLEKPFYDQLISLLELDPAECAGHMNPANWTRLKALFAETFRKKTRDEWCALLEGTDVCFAPVLSLTEAPGHPHIAARGTFRDHDGMVQPAPSPRFSRTPGEIAGPSRAAGADGRAILADLGLTGAQIDGLVASGAVKDPTATTTVEA